MSGTNLVDLARVVRSKNAGPYLLTFDVFLKDRATFDRVVAAGRFTADTAARAFGVAPAAILGFQYYPFVNAVKFSMRRPVASGGGGDSDVYGAQQHAPLLDLEIL